MKMPPIPRVPTIVRGVGDRIGAILSADRVARELLDIVRDTHRILLKLERVVDRLDEASAGWERRLQDMEISPESFKRLEAAILNIERGTLGVEAAIQALPKVLRSRIFGERT